MSQREKSAYWKALKDAGVEFTDHYRTYTTEALKSSYEAMVAERPDLASAAVAALHAPPPPPLSAQPQAQEQGGPMPQAASAFQQAGLGNRPSAPTAPRAPRNPDEMAGERLNTQSEDEPIRTDENGLVWYQEEVRKPAYAKPRGRRVMRYMESGTKTETIQNGQFMESFEVAGQGAQRPAEIKITMPSYQVGIYKDPRYPFRIHVYNENRGFDLREVQKYYGGSELVPAEIKRIYVENVLCYDMRTTIRAISTEYRQQQLAGRI